MKTKIIVSVVYSSKHTDKPLVRQWDFSPEKNPNDLVLGYHLIFTEMK